MENLTIVWGILACAAVLGILWCFQRSAPTVHIGSCVVVITGAASGLGKELAIQSVIRGARVALWDINSDALERVAEKVREIASASGGELINATVVDLASAPARRVAAVELMKVLEDEPGPMILINNAGIVGGLPLEDMPEEGIERIMQVNAIAPMSLTRTFLPSLMDLRPDLHRFGSRVVNIASAIALVPSGSLTSYTASKAALHAFTESLRIELSSLYPSQVPPLSTLSVLPFKLDTELFQGAMEGPHDPYIRKLIAGTLNTHTVAHQIIRAIENGTQTLTIPFHLHYLAYLFRFLPLPVYDTLVGYLGGWHGMDQAPVPTWLLSLLDHDQ